MRPQVQIPVQFPADPVDNASLLLWARQIKQALDQFHRTIEHRAIIPLHRFAAPLHTTSSRDLIERPVEGQFIYNQTLREPQYWNGESWVSIVGGGGGGEPPESATIMSHWFFANEHAGLVMKSSGGNYRLQVDDSDSSAPAFVVSPEGSPAFGDVMFSTPTSGPVTYGIYRGQRYRWLVDDSGGAPALVLQPAPSVTGQDMVFAYPGITFVLLGIPSGKKWECLVDDSDGSDIANVKPLLRKFWNED